MANLKLQYWQLEKLRHFAGNARNHSSAQVLELARNIQRFGFVNPILIDPNGEIIAGHGRALAADKLGMDKVPVIVLANLSDGEKRALRLADNKLAENSTWDDALLRAELKALKELEVSTDELGWDDAELNNLLREAVSILPETPYEPTPASVPQPTVAPGTDEGQDDGPGEDEDPEPPPAPKKAEPKASDDDYSVFELVMLHENKIRLVETLSKIRAERLYDKLEDALIHLVRHYDGEFDA